MRSPRIVSTETVTQTINGARQGRFIKEIIHAPIGDGSVCLIRKRAEGTPRGAALLIHGFGQNRYTWHLRDRSFANFLAEQGFDVFNLDLRGHGRSREAGSRHPERFEQYVEEDALAALEAVRTLSGFDRAFVLGHSLGGAVSFALAGHSPDAVAGVVSVAGVFRFGQGQPIFKHLSRLYRMGGKYLDPVLGLAPHLPLDLAGQLLHRVTPVLDHRAFGSSPLQVWYPGSIEPEILAERLLRGMDRTGFNILREMIEWAATGTFTGRHSQRDFAAAFCERDLPLLVLAADKDRLCTPHDCVAAYERSNSRDKSYVEFTPAQGNTHWGHVDLICGTHAPTYVWPVVADWMHNRSPSA
jgi:pimeloyl-ACP methyl ester carboxylesterase